MTCRARKIVHVDHESAWGGGESQVLGLMRYQERRGYQVLLASADRGSLAEKARETGLAVCPLDVRFHFDPVAGLKLRRLLTRAGCDIVHFHTSRAHALALWLPRTKVRLVVTRRMDYHLKGGWVVRQLYNRWVDRVVAISEGVKEALVESGVSRDRISVVYSGVDAERFRFRPQARAELRQALGVRGREVMALVPAALEERKGHRFLFSALQRLAGHGLQITVVCCGEGSLRSELEEMAARMGIDGMVKFAGFVTEMAEMLSAADVVVLPSLHEGLGVAILEAMAASRPVIATFVGGIPEVLADGEAGILVPPGDSDALGAALQRLVTDRELAERLGRAGRRRVEKGFSLEAMAEATEVCYQGLFGGCL